jgi:predicted Fe-Mo cluster-binding NifX family protein
MTNKTIAIPTDNDQGLAAPISLHFGHASFFTFVTVDIDSGEVSKVEAVPNTGHQQGGCMAPVMVVKNKQADAVILGGIGGRPLMGFIEVGVLPLRGVQGSVQDNLNAFRAGRLEQLMTSTCSGH